MNSRLLILGALALSLVACGGSGDQPIQVAPTETTSADTPTPTPTFVTFKDFPLAPTLSRTTSSECDPARFLYHLPPPNSEWVKIAGDHYTRDIECFTVEGRGTAAVADFYKDNRANLGWTMTEHPIRAGYANAVQDGWLGSFTRRQGLDRATVGVHCSFGKCVAYIGVSSDR